MFAYSLTGLQIGEAAAGAVLEVEESELTARSAVYQVLGKLFAPPDADHLVKATEGAWAADLRVAAELLAFDWEIGDSKLDGVVTLSEHVAEYDRLFLAEDGGAGRILGGSYVADRAQNLVELARGYEYYGLGTGSDDVAQDHLTAELDFLQFLCFKEAAATSPRLGKSFRRAQRDFLDRQIGGWVPRFAVRVQDDGPSAFWSWAIVRLESFVAADAKWAAG